MRRSINDVIRETYAQNRKVFSDKDRAAARIAWGIYMSQINGSGLRSEFDHFPNTIDKLLSRGEQHRNELKSLKFRANQFKELIKLLEKLKGRSAVQLNMLRWEKVDAPDIITRTLDPQAILTYRTFHTALAAYLDELGKKTPDWLKVAELAHGVVYTVNPKAWPEASTPVPERGIVDFPDTLWFLNAILEEPRED